MHDMTPLMFTPCQLRWLMSAAGRLLGGEFPDACLIADETYRMWQCHCNSRDLERVSMHCIQHAVFVLARSSGMSCSIFSAALSGVSGTATCHAFACRASRHILHFKVICGSSSAPHYRWCSE